VEGEAEVSFRVEKDVAKLTLDVRDGVDLLVVNLVGMLSVVDGLDVVL
jgi:hypothetical protein